MRACCVPTSGNQQRARGHQAHRGEMRYRGARHQTGRHPTGKPTRPGIVSTKSQAETGQQLSRRVRHAHRRPEGAMADSAPQREPQLGTEQTHLRSPQASGSNAGPSRQKNPLPGVRREKIQWRYRRWEVRRLWFRELRFCLGFGRSRGPSAPGPMRRTSGRAHERQRLQSFQRTRQGPTGGEDR